MENSPIKMEVKRVYKLLKAKWFKLRHKKYFIGSWNVYRYTKECNKVVFHPDREVEYHEVARVLGVSALKNMKPVFEALRVELIKNDQSLIEADYDSFHIIPNKYLTDDMRKDVILP